METVILATVTMATVILTTVTVATVILATVTVATVVYRCLNLEKKTVLLSIRLMCLSFWLSHLIREFPFWIFLGVQYFCDYTFFSFNIQTKIKFREWQLRTERDLVRRQSNVSCYAYITRLARLMIGIGQNWQICRSDDTNTSYQ